MFFRYPGGKRKLTGSILKYMSYFYSRNKNKNYCYVEPFFGGGGVGLSLLADRTKAQPRTIWINDYDQALACLWTSVIMYPSRLCKMVNDFVPSTDQFYEIKNILTSGVCISYLTEIDTIRFGFYKLAIHQISYSGLGTMSGGPLGGQKQQSKYKINSRWNASAICKKIMQINENLRGIKLLNERCTSLDFEEVLRYDQDAFYYLDPPYFDKGSQLYQFPLDLEDHQRLMSNLKSCRNPWLLSYDNCSEIRDLYDWATITEVEANYSINTSRNKKELIIFSPNYQEYIKDKISIPGI